MVRPEPSALVARALRFLYVPWVLVRQLMQRDVITLPAGATLDLVDDLMRVDRIRHVPVVSGGAVVGLVSHRDVVRAAVSNLLEVDSESAQSWLRQVPVGEVMTKEVLTAHPDAPIEGAIDMMLKERVGCLPVVDNGELVGLLTETDCLRYLSRLIHADNERRSLE